MKFRRVLATHYSNYSLLCILLSNAFWSTIWKLVEYKLLFPVGIFWCMLISPYYISCDYDEVILIKLSLVEYNYGCSKKYYWLYLLLRSMKYFLWDITYKIKCWWILTVLTFNKSIFWKNHSATPYKLVNSWASATPIV